MKRSSTSKRPRRFDKKGVGGVVFLVNIGFALAIFLQRGILLKLCSNKRFGI